MRTAIDDLLRSRVAWCLYSAIVVWALAAILLRPVSFILVENAVLISIGVGVSVAYAPYALDALRATFPSQAQLLALGIWLAWVAIAGERVYSLIGRALGKDIGFFNTSLHTGLIFLTAIGGACHLLAPEAVDGVIPRRAWVRMGIGACFSTLIICAVGYWFEV